MNQNPFKAGAVHAPLRPFLFLLLGGVIWYYLDWHSTWLLVENGGSEANPFLGHLGLSHLLALKLIFLLPIAACLFLSYAWKARFGVGLAASFNGWFLFLTVRNLSLVNP